MKIIRNVLIVIIIAGIGILTLRVFSFLKKTASIEGIAYLEVSETKVKPLKGLTVYLIRGRISEQMKRLQEEYDSSLGTVKEEVKLLQKSYYEKNEIADRDFLLLKRYEQLGKESDTYLRQQKRFEDVKAERDAAYKKYYTLLEDYSVKRNKYIGEFEEMITNDFLVSTETNEKGRYKFNNLLKNTYYLYAVTGSLINTNVWFLKIELNENKSVNLSKRNTAEIFE